MLSQDGIELLNYCWIPPSIPNQLTYGLLVAYTWKWRVENLYFQEETMLTNCACKWRYDHACYRFFTKIFHRLMILIGMKGNTIELKCIIYRRLSSINNCTIFCSNTIMILWKHFHVDLPNTLTINQDPSLHQRAHQPRW